MPYSIRPIQPQDNPSIANIVKSVMTSFGCVGSGYSIEDAEVMDMYAAYANDRAAYYVIEADEDKRLVGGCGLAQLLGGDTSVCELKKMYFLDEARGHGLGKEVLYRCIASARTFGYSQMYLETVERMESANGLYQAAGFQRLSEPMGSTGHSGCDRFYILNLVANDFQ